MALFSLQRSCLFLIAGLLLVPAGELYAQALSRTTVVPLNDVVVRAYPFSPATWWEDSGIALVADDQSILVVGGDGRVRDRFGRKGRGPGEFEQVVGLSVSGDTILALDARTRRLTSRLPNGAVQVQAVQWPLGAQDPIEPLALSARTIVFNVRYSSDPKISSEVVLIVRARIDGSIIDTVGPMYVAGTSGRVSFPGGSLTFSQPFVGADQLAIDSRSGWVALVHQPQTRFNGHGSNTRVIVRSSARSGEFQLTGRPVPLADGTVRAWLDENAVRWASRLGGVSPARQALAAQLVRPRNHPSVRRALVGHDGAVWLLRSPIDAPNAQWSIVDSRGNAVGTALLSPESHLLVVSASGAWALEESEDGEQILVRYSTASRNRR